MPLVIAGIVVAAAGVGLGVYGAVSKPEPPSNSQQTEAMLADAVSNLAAHPGDAEAQAQVEKAKFLYNLTHGTKSPFQTIPNMATTPTPAKPAAKPLSAQTIQQQKLTQLENLTKSDATTISSQQKIIDTLTAAKPEPSPISIPMLLILGLGLVYFIMKGKGR